MSIVNPFPGSFQYEEEDNCGHDSIEVYRLGNKFYIDVDNPWTDNPQGASIEIPIEAALKLAKYINASAKESK